jgi:TfoX/Sxy family transcriptional regulator of competence genes
MFGYDCTFVNGNFAAGLWQNTAVFKLSDEDGARFAATEGAVPFSPMEGRPMKSWWEAPEEVAHDAERLTAWCARAAAFARAQPPKATKAAKKTATGKSASAKPPARKK